MRGILARDEIEAMRAEEMVFLGMQRPAKTKEEVDNDPLSERN
jgi:predicted secreted protein